MKDNSKEFTQKKKRKVENIKKRLRNMRNRKKRFNMSKSTYENEKIKT